MSWERERHCGTGCRPVVNQDCRLWKPSERFFNIGIAENMMAIAAGFAQSGKIPFASTFAVFATGRAYDQIRQSIAYPNFNVKIVATHGGLTVGADGASHQSLEDIALMRVLPGMTVLVPADAEEAKQAVRAAVAHEARVHTAWKRGYSDVLRPAHAWKSARQPLTGRLREGLFRQILLHLRLTLLLSRAA